MGNGENQDNPESAIDLEALKRHDRAEWDRAIEILGLWNIALKSVNSHVGAKFPSEIEDVAIKSFTELLTKAIDRVDNSNGIAPMLRTICRNRSLDFLKRKAQHFVQGD